MSPHFRPWLHTPGQFVLENSDVHVWLASLDRAEPVVRRLLKTLAPDERERAGRFYFQVDRDHFIVARGTLRAILSRYLETGPDQVRFYYASHGKPGLAKELDRHGLRFNVSHSQGLALFAVTLNREVGVDIEAIRPGIAGEKIAERFFSPHEVCVLRALPKDLQDEAFFNCWTRKEAYIKAKGEGLSMPLDCFDVSLVPGEPAALLSTRADPEEASRWSLRELFPAPGFVGAVIAEGKDWQLKCWEWTE